MVVMPVLLLSACMRFKLAEEFCDIGFVFHFELIPQQRDINSVKDAIPSRKTACLQKSCRDHIPFIPHLHMILADEFVNVYIDLFRFLLQP